jgi:hypothetical protein
MVQSPFNYQSYTYKFNRGKYRIGKANAEKDVTIYKKKVEFDRI